MGWTKTCVGVLAIAVSLGCDGGGEDSPDTPQDSGIGSATAPSSGGTGSGSDSANGSGDGAGSGNASGETSASGGTGSNSDGEATSSEDATGPDPSSGDTSTGAPSCAGACVDLPPGWSGPARMHVNEEAACDGDYPGVASELYRGLVAPPAACDCTCGAASGMGCSQSTQDVRYRHDDGPFCPSPFSFGSIPSCQFISGGLTSPGGRFAIEVDGGFWPPGDCPAIPQTTIDPVAWTEEITLCGGFTSAPGCEETGGACITDQGPSQVCVYSPSESDCSTAGAFTELQPDIHAAVTDERSCSACSCSNPTGTCRMTSITFYDGSCSSFNAVQTQNINDTEDCLTLPDQPVQRFRVNNFTLPPGDISCTPSNVQAEGEATPANPVTVCCLP